MDQHLARPDGTLAYCSEGPQDAERTVVVAHSLAVSREWEDDAGIFDWRPIIEAPSRLVRFDTRGHGASTGAPIAQQYQWPNLARDLLALADVVSPTSPIDGLGESTGSGVVLWAAHLAPRRFRRLVLAIPPTHGPARVQQAGLYRAAASMIELRGVEAWQRVQALTPPAPDSARRGMDSSRPHRRRRAAAAGCAPRRGRQRSPAGRIVAAIEVPTLILTWDTDPSHPIETAEHLAALLPEATLHIARTPDEIRSWGSRAAAFLGHG